MISLLLLPLPPLRHGGSELPEQRSYAATESVVAGIALDICLAVPVAFTVNAMVRHVQRLQSSMRIVFQPRVPVIYQRLPSFRFYYTENSAKAFALACREAP